MHVSWTQFENTPVSISVGWERLILKSKFFGTSFLNSFSSWTKVSKLRPSSLGARIVVIVFPSLVYFIWSICYVIGLCNFLRLSFSLIPVLNDYFQGIQVLDHAYGDHFHSEPLKVLYIVGKDSKFQNLVSTLKCKGYSISTGSNCIVSHIKNRWISTLLDINYWF